MTSASKNKAGGHTHPQKNKDSHNQQGDSRKGSETDKPGAGKDGEVKESLGKSGAKDSH